MDKYAFTPSEYVCPVPPHLLILLQVSMSQLMWGYLFLIACRHMPVVLLNGGASPLCAAHCRFLNIQAGLSILLSGGAFPNCSVGGPYVNEWGQEGVN